MAAVQSGSVQVYWQRGCAVLLLRLALTPLHATDLSFSKAGTKQGRNRGSVSSPVLRCVLGGLQEWGGWSSASQGIQCSAAGAVVTVCQISIFLALVCADPAHKGLSSKVWLLLFHLFDPQRDI